MTNSLFMGAGGRGGGREGVEREGTLVLSLSGVSKSL